MKEDLENLIAGTIDEATKSNRRSEEAADAAKVTRQQRVDFLAGFMGKLESFIRPAFTAVEEKIEGARKIGRWSQDQEGASKELGAVHARADVDTPRAELILSHREIFMSLVIEADQARALVTVRMGRGESWNDLKLGGPTFLQLTEVSPALVDEYLAKLLEAMKRQLKQ